MLGKQDSEKCRLENPKERRNEGSRDRFRMGNCHILSFFFFWPVVLTLRAELELGRVG
jgi:hypothetical protein